MRQPGSKDMHVLEKDCSLTWPDYFLLSSHTGRPHLLSHSASHLDAVRHIPDCPDGGHVRTAVLVHQHPALGPQLDAY